MGREFFQEKGVPSNVRWTLELNDDYEKVDGSNMSSGFRLVLVTYAKDKMAKILSGMAQSEDEVSERVKRSVLLKHAPAEIQSHLQVNGSTVRDYDQMRAVVITYLDNKKVYPTEIRSNCVNHVAK